MSRFSLKVSAFSLIWVVGLGNSAINLDGSQAVEPLAQGDPCPISDINTYHPDQYDCPLPCIDYANIHNWTPYFSVDRLDRCESPLLLQLSITQPLDDRGSGVLIRSCTLSPSQFNITRTLPLIQNPKKSPILFGGGTLRSAPACIAPFGEGAARLNLATTGNGKGDNSHIIGLLKGMNNFFSAKDNCDETLLFARHGKTVASMYIGGQLSKKTAASTITALITELQSSGALSNQTAIQLCDTDIRPERVIGISIDNTGDLAAVQKAALRWSEGKCAAAQDFHTSSYLSGVQVFTIADRNKTAINNGIRTATSWTRRSSPRLFRRDKEANQMITRATCRAVEIVMGDDCASLASRCTISGADLSKYNPKAGFCSTLRPGAYACCSLGDPYVPPKPEPPKPDPDGTCATHLIQNGDSCDKLAEQYGVTTTDLEKWNKGKTWAWTECRDMLIGYNMCLSDGNAPMPPPQQGAECGPLVPGTKPPKDKSTSLADLNPCPLRACCSNWGFCGVFPAHCDIHAPPGGGPGTKEKGFQNTCVSNCGNEIKQNSGPPPSFQRIGYYESFGLDRDCLWLKAKNANTDGTYSHIHWGFAAIDPSTWKPMINDTKKQWEEFKKLPNMKRILSFGGWAYSTEPATYNIIRSAILENRDVFATNVAQFVNDEGIDGVDIDWEYPGAPDIYVDGQPIGQKRDGIDYLKFLMVLKKKLGPGKSLSIAAPASYWYLKAFPIDRIAAVIDYIVYMTYDLHGQWDYGNSNAFDSCPSGRCIRSHVNLTETRNALSMLTKAGVPNNKVFVGESSYGRSFHMAEDGCWGPTCDFTGSKAHSDANPGRCTKTGGYLAYAEIMEILKQEDGVRTFHDGNSNTDVMLFKGDYISYMTPTTKDTRRADWKGLNFAGSIDWAVDLQMFTQDDFNAVPDRPTTGQGCIGGTDNTVDSGNLCEFACELGFCPDHLCTCKFTGELKPLPKETNSINVTAWDEVNLDLNRLCKFACKYGYCPMDICTTELSENDNQADYDPNYNDDPYSDPKLQNQQLCQIYKDPRYRDAGLNQCKPICQATLDEAKEEGRTANWGCVGHFPLEGDIPWARYPGSTELVVPGQCSCDNWLVNEIAQEIIDAMPIIAQIGCYILMSSLKFVLDVGAQFIPGAGRAIDAGLDMAMTAAQLASYIYPQGEDPEGAFSWWLSVCPSDLVPNDIKRIFDILTQVGDGLSSFRKPKNIPKGSGKKGDSGNPKSPPGPRQPSGGNGNKPKKKKCNIPPQKELSRVGGGGKNTLRSLTCVNDKTKTKDFVVTTVTYAPNAKATQVTKTCDRKHLQACYHYSSAIRVNKQWSTLPCPQGAATTSYRFSASATATYRAEHTGTGWKDKQYRQFKDQCDMDEFPPAYLLDANNPAFIYAGKDKRGQRVRYIPWTDNQGAGQSWKGMCFVGVLDSMSDKDLQDLITKGSLSKPTNPKPQKESVNVAITVDRKPELIFDWDLPANPSQDDGLSDNGCWPKDIAVGDPGFALLSLDDWYDTNKVGTAGRRTKWDYRKPYVKGQNGD